MSLHFQTESGAHYELEQGQVRRFEGSDGNTKRRDGDWIRVRSVTNPRVGHCVLLVLESLAADGPDDYGTTEPDPLATTRVTTPVTRIWED